MAIDPVPVTPGAGFNIAADSVGNNVVQVTKLWDATAGSSNAAIVGADGALHANVTNTINANITGGNVTATVPANLSVNVDQVGGAAFALGQAAMAGSLPVAIANNQGTLSTNANITGGNVVVTGNVVLPANITANVTTVPANMTVNLTSVSGTTVNAGNSTAANSLSVVIATNQAAVPVTLPANITANVTSLPANATVNLNMVGGTAVVTGGVNGSQGVGGLAASGSAAAGDPVWVGGQALTAIPGNLGNGTASPLVTDASGRLLVMPYANKELWVRGTATIGNTVQTQVIAAQGAGNKTYITSIQLGNTGNTTVTVSFNDSATSVFIVPSGGGSNVPFPVPLVTGVNANLAMTLSANTTSIFCNAQGYIGP